MKVSRKYLFSKVKIWRELICFFHQEWNEWKNKQIKFSIQNFIIELNFFYTNMLKRNQDIFLHHIEKKVMLFNNLLMKWKFFCWIFDKGWGSLNLFWKSSLFKVRTLNLFAPFQLTIQWKFSKDQLDSKQKNNATSYQLLYYVVYLSFTSTTHKSFWGFDLQLVSNGLPKILPLKKSYTHFSDRPCQCPLNISLIFSN